jgi:hypothetical protein
MRSYVGTKIINAEKMTKQDFDNRGKGLPSVGWTVGEAGYHVVYGNPEGEYHSWSPAHVFEEAYREVSSGEQLLVKKTMLP